MPEVEVNGTRLYYQQSGDGPDVVLVHAVTSNQAVWVFAGLVDALAADFRVTSYDLRGHGFSDRPPTVRRIFGWPALPWLSGSRPWHPFI